MTEVLLARSAEPSEGGRLAAVKYLPRGCGGEPLAESMFAREATLAARLSHPNVVSVLEVCRDRDGLCLVMEYMDGPTLAVLVRTGPLPLCANVTETAPLVANCPVRVELPDAQVPARHANSARLASARALDRASARRRYNDEHYHVSLALLHPVDVHYGRADDIIAARQRVLDDAHRRHPERFVRGQPTQKAPPAAAWINLAIDDHGLLEGGVPRYIHATAVSNSLTRAAPSSTSPEYERACLADVTISPNVTSGDATTQAGGSVGMRWPEVCDTHPDPWLVIEVLDARSQMIGDRRIIDRVAVMDICVDGRATMKRYAELRRLHPHREFCFVHTSMTELKIEERLWLGIRGLRAADLSA